MATNQNSIRAAVRDLFAANPCDPVRYNAAGQPPLDYYLDIEANGALSLGSRPYGWNGVPESVYHGRTRRVWLGSWYPSRLSDRDIDAVVREIEAPADEESRLRTHNWSAPMECWASHDWCYGMIGDQARRIRAGELTLEGALAEYPSEEMVVELIVRYDLDEVRAWLESAIADSEEDRS